ncbi:hypothetical protein NITHO_2720006 [Nitrolancea hollandica Lb]|uniref:Uncharacterized protein n=1 Tax=Nitrolancea hollandica Lb TaxID=1129897 RepID=I4EGI7_9BACT|nr:hypothetical protein NITHO_2720006 [Nitrolancea hollandica Lb]
MRSLHCLDAGYKSTHTVDIRMVRAEPMAMLRVTVNRRQRERLPATVEDVFQPARSVLE